MAAAAEDDGSVDVDSFFRDLSQLEREAEVGRVLASFKLNPLEVLNVNHTATPDEIAKAYRTASLRVHPDKLNPEWRERGQQAFTMLAAAKEELLDGTKREPVMDLVDQARQRVLTNKTAEFRKKRKTAEGADASTAEEEYDPSKDPAYDSWIKAEMKEILIEKEWRKRQLLKAAAQEDVIAAQEKEKRTKEREEKKKDEQDWEDGRDQRVNSWRDFQKGGVKGKMAKVAKFKPPKRSETDSENTYIRRAPGQGSADK